MPTDVAEFCLVTAMQKIGPKLIDLNFQEKWGSPFFLNVMLNPDVKMLKIRFVFFFTKK